MNLSPTNEQDTEIAVRLELLRLALHNLGRSIPIQFLAVAWVAYLGLSADRPLAAVVVGALGVAGCLWRVMLVRRFAPGGVVRVETLDRACSWLEANSMLAGFMWLIATFLIYAHLVGTEATAFAVLACGSVSLAAFFMSLVGRSFLLLAVPELGGVVLVSMFGPTNHSWPLALLVTLFGITMYFASREFTDTATRAIRHSLNADAASHSLKLAKEAAESANLAKSQFLATMSHEIRTPMNGVLGALELLRRSGLDADQRRLVRTASSSGASLMNILNDVLDHSKIEAGKLNLAQLAFSLSNLTGSVVALFRGNAETKGLMLTLDVGPDVEDWLVGDAQRLKQVLLNLVGNAIKFTERGEVQLRVSARPSQPGFASLDFEVRDTGIGISSEAIEGLFQPFYQVDGTRSRRRGGTGLGLAISQRIVEAMGGEIQVRSRPGHGSRFRFSITLPYDRSSARPIATDSALGGLDGDSVLSGTVLVVEDNDVNRMIAREVLQSLGMDVIEASNGRQALDQIASNRVDVVLMDCQMPVMDGYAATEAIRLRETRLGLPRLPVLALTADAFDEDAARSREAGMDAHLAKPYTREQLRDFLHSWVH